MSYEIKLRMPDDMYRRLTRIAATRNQALEAAIIEQIDRSLIESREHEFQLAGDEAEQEVATFHALHPRLREEFPGEYVAIQGGELIDHDPDRLLLFERIESRYPDKFVLIRPVRESVDREFQFRSPHLESRQ